MIDSTDTTAVSSQFSWRKKVVRRWLWLPFLVGVLVCVAWVWVDGRSVKEPIIRDDINQHRANTPLPVPTNGLTLEQSFFSRWNGLREVEVLIAGDGTAGHENGRLQFQLLDQSGAVVAEKAATTTSLSPDQTFAFQFPPLADSAGRRYTLRISGNEDNPVSVWGYNLDVYKASDVVVYPGALSTHAPVTFAKDLRFITWYELTWQDALVAVVTAVLQSGTLLLVSLLFLPLPGVLMLLIKPAGEGYEDALAWLGAALALGVSGWALLWQWLSLVNGRFSGWLLWGFVIGGWGVVLALWFKRKRTRITNYHWEHLTLLILLVIAFSVRLLAVRDLAFPPWVDSSRHALITAVMAEQGQTPSAYTPYLPVDRFPYHFGYHALAASLRLMTGWDLPQLLLLFGQLLNALVVLTVYAGGWFFTRRRLVGLLAAFLVALPFFFPAYYVSWGRMTQLTAVLLMPVLLGLTWRLVRGATSWRQTWWLVGVLAAGLFLVHFRVFFYFLPFALMVWLMSVGRNGRWLAMAAGLGALLVAPHALNLLLVTEPVKSITNTIEGYNEFPVGYLNSGWERPFIYLAGILFWLLIIPALRRRTWTTVPLALAGWVALLFLITSADRWGLPGTALININSMYITVFIPLSIFLAMVAVQIWRWLQRRHWLGQILGAFIAGGLLTATFLFGIFYQINILNSNTILAWRPDAEGLAWVDENLPPEATLAASTWKWLGNTWAGHDGGAWLNPLTRRMSNALPIDHIYNRQLFAANRELNQQASSIEDWSTAAAANWLRENGFTHLYVGARGGFLNPAQLNQNPAIDLLYARDGVFIFEIKN
ncbi:MAG: hypothetical protein CSB13_01345 [Chloroflexi bacterium]|nr:MAG: hypothetical protein CSB13_01345 [Chloroflexota bacterium]